MQENALLNMQSLYLISKFSFFIDENTLEIFVYKHRIFQFQMKPIHSAYTFNLWIQVVCKKNNMLKKEYTF